MNAVDYDLKRMKNVAVEKSTQPEASDFVVSINKADTTRDELAGLLAESNRIAEKQRSNIKRIGDILGVNERMMQDFD